MTAGHAHRLVHVRREGLVHRLLTFPVWHTYNRARVEASPYPYGPCQDSPVVEPCWYLSALSVLHRWVGLTLVAVPDGTRVTVRRIGL